MDFLLKESFFLVLKKVLLLKKVFLLKKVPVLKKLLWLCPRSKLIYLLTLFFLNMNFLSKKKLYSYSTINPTPPSELLESLYGSCRTTRSCIMWLTIKDTVWVQSNKPLVGPEGPSVAASGKKSRGVRIGLGRGTKAQQPSLCALCGRRPT